MLHTIHFLCPVNTATVGQLQNHCLTALSQGATELNIHISSQGGETAAGFTAYNFLKSLPVAVRTHNISNVESIANIVFWLAQNVSQTHYQDSCYILYYGALPPQPPTMPD